MLDTGSEDYWLAWENRVGKPTSSRLNDKGIIFVYISPPSTPADVYTRCCTTCLFAFQSAYRHERVFVVEDLPRDILT